MMTPPFVAAILGAQGFILFAVALLTLPYWASAIAKSVDWRGGVAEMRAARLSPAPIFAALTIAVQAVGSLLLLTGYAPWLGAGMLGGFTIVATWVAHPFWRQADAALRLQHRTVFLEHIGLIGGLMLAAALLEYHNV